MLAVVDNNQTDYTSQILMSFFGGMATMLLINSIGFCIVYKWWMDNNATKSAVGAQQKLGHEAVATRDIEEDDFDGDLDGDADAGSDLEEMGTEVGDGDAPTQLAVDDEGDKLAVPGDRPGASDDVL